MSTALSFYSFAGVYSCGRLPSWFANIKKRCWCNKAACTTSPQIRHAGHKKLLTTSFQVSSKHRLLHYMENKGAGFPRLEDSDTASAKSMFCNPPLHFSHISPTTKQLTNDEILDVVFCNSSERLTNVNPTERARVGFQSRASSGCSDFSTKNANQKQLTPTQL